jgi:DNA-binding PadR family transcriptional regulator
MHFASWHDYAEILRFARDNDPAEAFVMDCALPLLDSEFCPPLLTSRQRIVQYDVVRHSGIRHMESLPLSEPVLLVLLSLAEQPRHGYSILKDVERMSGGRVKLSTGTLYGALRRLLEEAWIERIEEDESPRDRRPYRLTSRGRRNLQLEVARMKQLTKLAALRVARKEV